LNFSFSKLGDEGDENDQSLMDFLDFGMNVVDEDNFFLIKFNGKDLFDKQKYIYQTKIKQ
jgi:hypothetical protein